MAQTPQERETDELVREFLRQLDACKTEQERIEVVMILVSNVVQGAMREMERQMEQS